MKVESFHGKPSIVIQVSASSPKAEQAPNLAGAMMKTLK